MTNHICSEIKKNCYWNTISIRNWTGKHLLMHFSTMRMNGRMHGLRTPNEAFIHWNPKLGRWIVGHLGFVRPNYQHPFWYILWVPCPCPCFPWIDHYFYKKLMPCPSMWPKQFWSVQNGFGHEQFILVVTKSLWSS